MFTRVVICENKSRSNEIRDVVWKAALNQGSEYARTVRAPTNVKALHSSLFLTVNIGTYMRFYEIEANGQDAIDRAPAQGRLYELAVSEKEVWELWQKMRSIILARQS